MTMAIESSAGRGSGRSVRRRVSSLASTAALSAGLLAGTFAGPLAAPVRAATTGDGLGNGWVMAWGNDSEGQTNVPAAAEGGVVAIAAGGSAAMALTWDGKVIAWGDDYYGQTDVPAGLANVKAISAGSDYDLALKKNGSVVAWGNDGCGQTDVPTTARSGVTAISAGAGFAVALKSDGSIVTWGCDANFWASIPSTNVKVGSRYLRVPISNLKSVSASTDVLGLEQDGTVAGWNDDSYGQADVPAGLGNATAVSAGYTFSLALKSNGSIAAWGDSSDGQLWVPCQHYQGLCFPITGFSAIAAGDRHALAIKDGNLYAWGDNYWGETTISGDLVYGGFVSVAAGNDFSLALYGLPSAPGQVYDVLATAGNGSASVTWSGAPIDQWGAPLTRYTITSSPGGKTCVAAPISVPVQQCTVTGLTNGTTYTFTVTATNGLGTTVPSAPSNPVTPAAP